MKALPIIIFACGLFLKQPCFAQLVKERATLVGHTKAVFSLAFSPDGKNLASAGGDNTVRVWDVASGKERMVLRGHQDWGVLSVAFSPSGNLLASSGLDKTVRIWEFPSGKEKLVLKPLSGPALCVAFSPNGKLLAIGGQGPACPDSGESAIPGELKIWDLTTGSEWASLKVLYYIGAVVFSPDGYTLASGEDVGKVTLWEISTRKVRGTFKCHGGDLVKTLAFTKNGNILASGSSDNIIIWDLPKGKELGTLKGHKGSVYGIALTQDGRLLASASEDRTIKLWNLKEFKEILTLKQENQIPWCVAFSPNGKILAAGMYKTIKLWDINMD